MIGLTHGLVLAAVMSFTVAAAAPGDLPPADPNTIVVTGQRNSEQDMRDFVRALTPTRPGGLLSRFEQSVCPVAVGLPQAQRDLVSARMRRVARGAGIPVGGATCVPNVVVMVTNDKKILMQELRRRHPHYFGDISQSRMRALAKQPGPVVAWQLQGAPISARGTELFYDPAMQAYVNRTTEAASRMHAGGRPQFDGAVVVVERRALAGLTVTQLADYAAMRAFAGTDPRLLRQSATPTILRVIEAPMGSPVPLSLTQSDMEFLRSFYAVPRNLQAAAQRSAIQRNMEKAKPGTAQR